jgi:hypothetical protein
MNLLVRCAPFAILLFLVNCGSMPESAPTPLAAVQQRLRVSPQPSVLFVGNSFSQGVPQEFERIAAKQGTHVRTRGVTNDGWTLSRHAKFPDTLETIRSGAWDVVVLQEQSRLPARSGWMRRMKMRPSLTKLADAARSAGAIPVLMQTWGYRNGDETHSGDNFHRMTERLRIGIQEEATLAQLPVIPVGDAWQREVTRGAADALFHPDGKHPSPTGNQTTARAVYELLFPPSPSQRPHTDGNLAGLSRAGVQGM